MIAKKALRVKTMESTAAPEWKQLIQLGEQLVVQSTPAGQCQILCETVIEMFTVEAQIWLAAGAYLFPGETQRPLPLLPQSPPLAQKAAQERRILGVGPSGKMARPLSPRSRPVSVAFPLQENGTLIGVLQVKRSVDHPFSKHILAQLEALVNHASMAMEITRQEHLKNWRYQQLNLVRLASAQIANLRDPLRIYAEVTTLIQETFHLYYVGIFTLDEAQHTLQFRANAGQKSNFVPDFSVNVGEGIIGWVGQSGEELVAPDVRAEPRYRYLDVLPETISEAALPLKVENRLLGVLDIQSDHPAAFHEVDMLVLRTLADTISLAMESAILYDHLHRRAEQISSVFEVSHALASILDQEQLLKEVVNLIHRRFGYPFIHVFTVHPGRRRVFYEAGSGERSETMHKQEFSYPLDGEKGLIPWVARNGKTYLANDVLQDELYLPSDLPPNDTRAELTVPLLVGQEVVGVLDIQSEKVNAFDENDRSLFEALAATIATAIRNAGLYRSERWRRQVAETFKDVAYLMTTNQPLNELLDVILEKLERNLPCDASAIWLLEENNGGEGEPYRLRLAATRHIDPESMIQVVGDRAEAQAMLENALQSEQPLIRRADQPFGPLGAAMNFPNDYSSIAATLRTNRRPLGILTLAHASGGRYGSEAQAITATFANYAAVAIQNGRLYREAQEQALVSTMLLQVAEASQSTMTVEDLLSTMMRLVRLLMGVRKCAFLLWEESLQTYQMKAWYGFDLPGAESTSRPLYSSELPAMRRLIQEKATLYLQNSDIELNLPEISLDQQNGTLVMLPLLVRGEVMGAFLVAYQAAAQVGQEERFDPKALGILQGIAQQTAITVDNLRLLEARQEEAYVTAALLQVAQTVVSSTDLHDTLDTIVHLLPILVGIDACIMYLWDAGSRLFRPIQAYAGSRREEETMLSTAYAPGENTLLDTVFLEGSMHLCQVTDDSAQFIHWAKLACQHYDENADQSAPPIGNWLLGYPLSLPNMVMGVMVVQEMTTSPAFWERRMEIINGIAQQVSMSIQNDIYKQEMVENQRIEGEIQLARQIQETFLPTSLPRLQGWELDLRWEMAREVGGDFYDVFKLDGNRLGLVIADVSDKGLPAALYMTVTRTLIHAFAAGGNDPARVLKEVNDLLVNDSPESMFITAIYSILSLETGELVYANAGHNLPLLYGMTDERVHPLPKGGMALGILKEMQLENHLVQIEMGDTLILYTDGAVDLMSPKNESFGEPRLRHVIEQYGKEKVGLILENLDDALADFRQGIRPFDDITIVAIQRAPKAKENNSG